MKVDHSACILDDKNIKRAFELAYEAWRLTEKSAQSAVVIDSVRLYSYASPSAARDSLWEHLSPRRIYDRLRHADRKDALHFDSRGEIYCPGLEIRLCTKDDAYRLRKALEPLSPTHSPSIPPLWRVVIRSVTFLLTLRRRLAGEKILAFYATEDGMYFGSVYTNGGAAFFAVHGQTREAVECGARRLISFLSAP